jgi:hypothetical protein
MLAARQGLADVLKPMSGPSFSVMIVLAFSP